MYIYIYIYIYVYYILSNEMVLYTIKNLLPIKYISKILSSSVLATILKFEKTTF